MHDPPPSTSRLPTLDERSTDTGVRSFFATLARRGRRPLNLHRAIAHAPAVAVPFVNLALDLREKTTLERKLCELVILRTAHLRNSGYELQQHAALSRASGVSPEQLDALQGRRESALFTDAERCALDLTDELVATGALDSATFARAATFFTPQQLVELSMTIGFYACTAIVLGALGVALEAE